ncbi:MAG: sulfide/dihydroorotate dehydrogenase-like FAD/NAD-binding protein [Eubacteriales bacterium]
MNYEIIDCIDAGTEFCPCHLAESEECLLCSQLQGKEFCDCKNWKGTCIYQEFEWNNGKVQQGRKYFNGRIVEKKYITDNVILLNIKTDHYLCKNLLKPGSFIFLRNPNTHQYFDVPISIMECNLKEDTLTMIIEIEGIKTKKIDLLKIEEDILLKGPFWNGIFGIKHINHCKEKSVMVLARGIGQAPIIPLLKKLNNKGNRIFLLLDKGKYEEIFIQEYLSTYHVQVIPICTMINGKLTVETIEKIEQLLIDEQVEHIHCAGPDILIKEIIALIKKRITTSCCNNAKMCCGEGVCGACTTRFEGQVVKRLCKLQTDPEYIFEGRRFI